MLRRLMFISALTLLWSGVAGAAQVRWINETGQNVEISGIITPDRVCPPTHVIREFRDQFIGIGRDDVRTIQDGTNVCWTWRFHEEGATRPDKYCIASGNDIIHIKKDSDQIAACHQVPLGAAPSIQWRLIPHPTGVSGTSLSPPHNVTAGSFVAVAASGDICLDFHIADGVSWPETRWVEDLCCVDTPFGKICSNCPKCEKRDCTKRYYAQICMPDPGEAGRKALEKCVPIAAGAALATLICCGPQAAAGIFTDALRACLIAEGQSWANSITVNLREESDCGNWHNCT